MAKDDSAGFTVDWFTATFVGSRVCVYEGVNNGDPCIGIKAPGGTWRRTAVPRGSTRGDVRRFMQWQGLQPRKEEPDASQDS